MGKWAWITIILVSITFIASFTFMWYNSAAYDNAQRLACVQAGGIPTQLYSGGTSCIRSVK